MDLKQYDIYWVSLDPALGNEMKKTRPCVIISPDEMHNYIGTVIIAPLTSAVRNYPSRIKYKLKGKASMIALDQVKTVDKTRLYKKIESLDSFTINQIKKRLEDIFIK